jgi:hypothetical protein
METTKASVRFDANLQFSIWVYQAAKVRMLDFMYDFLFACCDTRKFQFMQTDTDSLSVALAGDGTLRSCVRPDKMALFDELEPHFIESAATKKLPGYFKVESEATHTICLGSKTILHKLVEGTAAKPFKSSTKGMRKSDPLCSDLMSWRDVLINGGNRTTDHTGFRLHPGYQDQALKKTMATYQIVKVGISGRYDKRQLHADEHGNLLWTSPLPRSAEAPVINWDEDKSTLENLLRKSRSRKWVPVEEADAAGKRRRVE